jgi:hypothetical protein
VKTGRNLRVIPRNILPPSSGSKSKPRKQAENTLVAAFFFGLHFDPENSGLHSSETSVNYITRHHIPQDSTLRYPAVIASYLKRLQLSVL